MCTCSERSRNEPPKKAREGYGPSYSIAITCSNGGPGPCTLPPRRDAAQTRRKDDLPEIGIEVLNPIRKLMAERDGSKCRLNINNICEKVDQAFFYNPPFSTPPPPPFYKRQKRHNKQ